MPIPVTPPPPAASEVPLEIVVDGVAAEAAWSEAFVVDDFLTHRPSQLQQPFASATVRLLIDPEGIHLFWEIVDPEPEEVRGRYRRRDSIWRDDTVGLYVDTRGDAQSAYSFFSNPLGVQADGVLMPGSGDDMAWDGRWYSAGTRTDEGYNVEISIPWASLDHPAEMERVGISLLYTTTRKGERASWPHRDPDVSGILVQQTHMPVPAQVAPTAPWSLIPELTWSSTADESTGHLAWAGFSPGLTATASIGRNGTAQATINPDFSQVESDSQQLDINNRYALYYQEKRPFFTEGAQWLEFGFEGVTYTRSMVSPIAGGRVDVDRTGGHVALLTVLDSDPTGSLSEEGGWSSDDVEGHNASTSVVRGRTSVGSDGYAGAILSHKEIVGTEMNNSVGGADGRFRFGDSLVVEGALLGSTTSSADGQRNTSGAGSLSVELENARYEMEVGLDAVGRNFRAEAGYVTAADSYTAWAETKVKFHPNERLTRLYFSPMDGIVSYHGDGTLRELAYGPGLSLSLPDNSHIWIGGGYAGELYADQWVDNFDLNLFMRSAPLRAFAFHSFVGAGGATWYDSENPRSVDHIIASIGSTLLLGPHLSVEMNIHGATYQEEGEVLDSSILTRVQPVWFFSQNTWSRVTLSHDGEEELDIEALLAFERPWGGRLYLGASIDSITQEESGEFSLFAKVSGRFGG